MHSLESHLRAVWVEKHGDYYLSTIYRPPIIITDRKITRFHKYPSISLREQIVSDPKVKLIRAQR